MVNKTVEQVDAVFSALADVTRRGIVERLGAGELSVSALAEPLPMSLPAVVQHLKVLEDAGLVRSQKVGRVRTCRLEVKTLATVEDWIAARKRMWESRLDALGEFLQATEPNDTPNPEEKK